jgi:hypothetical protein
MRHQSALREHSLSLVIGSVLLTLLLLYWRSDPMTHLGAFYGNAVADWLGSLVTVVATKFWFEQGSAESRRPPPVPGTAGHLWHKHSLTIVLVVTWLGWIWWYVHIEGLFVR